MVAMVLLTGATLLLLMLLMLMGLRHRLRLPKRMLLTTKERLQNPCRKCL